MIEFKTKSLQGNMLWSNTVWLNEIIKCSQGTEELHSVLEASYVPLDIKHLIYEYKSNQHISNYGLLGFEFVPQKSNSLDLLIYYNKPTLNQKPKGFSEEVITEGLGEEFAQAVQDEITAQLYLKQYIPSGIMKFSFAKCSNVGSSIKRFQFIIRFLINVFHKNNEKICVDELEQILDETKVSMSGY